MVASFADRNRRKMIQANRWPPLIDDVAAEMPFARKAARNDLVSTYDASSGGG